MPQTVDLFDRHTLIEFIDESEAYKPTDFLSKTMFPASVKIEGVDIMIDIKKGKRKVAPFVSPVVEGKVIENQGYSTKTIRPPYTKMLRITTAEDLLKRQPGEIPFIGGKTPMDFAEEQLGEDLTIMTDMVHRLVEVMAAQALVTGKILVRGEGVDQEIDFLRDSSHEYALTGIDAWSDGIGSDPIFDLRAWKLQIQKDSSLNATLAIFAEDVLEVFLSHPKVQKMLDLLRVDNLAKVKFYEESPSVSYVGTFFGIDVVTYNAWYYDEVLAEDVPYIPAGTVLMCVPGAESGNSTRYGAIKNVECGTISLPIFPDSWVEKDPSARVLRVESAPLVALVRPESTVMALVLEP